MLQVEPQHHSIDRERDPRMEIDFLLSAPYQLYIPKPQPQLRYLHEDPAYYSQQCQRDHHPQRNRKQLNDRRTTWDFQTVCFEMQEKDIVEVTSSCLDRKRRVEVVLPERKRRRRISITQKEILEAWYRDKAFPTVREREFLSSQLQLSMQQVNTWYGWGCPFLFLFSPSHLVCFDYFCTWCFRQFPFW